MHRVVFYSWQSDLPNPTNRSFIQKALENVTKGISADDSVDVHPVVDRDTQGVPGSPDIAKTIFQKIASADVMVADVSLINHLQPGRPTPNPNVLLELGYALRALGDERVVLVFNTAYGKIEDLPFDLRMRRMMSYEMSELAPERSTERKALESKFNDAIRAALASIKPAPTVSLLSDAINSIENLKDNRVLVVRRFQDELYERIRAKRPKSAKEWTTAQDLVGVIKSTVDIALEYTRLASTIAAMGDERTATDLYRGFGQVLEAYDRPSGFCGPICFADFDLMKFIGHEFFTTFVACLIREELWELISKLLAQTIPVNYRQRENGPADCEFADISEHLELLYQRTQEEGRKCLHADLLKDRHEQGPLGTLMPFVEFFAADYFLFLRRELSSDETQTFSAWLPWSTMFMRHSPRFIRDAWSAAKAQKIAVALGVADAETLKQKLRDRADGLRKMWGNGFWTQPVSASDIDKIGTL